MAKRVTLTEIGREAGVSPVAVSAALGLLSENSSVRISKKRAEMIRKVAHDMGYQPNLVARAFRQQRTRIIGVLFRVVSNPLSVSYLMDCMHRQLIDNDYHGYLNPYQSSVRVLEEKVSELIAWQADGLIISHVFSDEAKGESWERVEQSLSHVKLPLVLVESTVSTSIPHAAVQVDQTAAMRLAAEHLLTLGHRQLAFVGDGRSVASERWQGIQAAAAACPGAQAQVITLERDPDATAIQRLAGASRKTGHVIAQMPNRPTGIICTNDIIAAGVMAGLRDCGLDVPRDASIIGYDDSDHAIIAQPQLTSLRPPIEQLAQTAVELLINQVEHSSPPAHRMLEATLIKRGSTAPPPST